MTKEQLISKITFLSIYLEKYDDEDALKKYNELVKELKDKYDLIFEDLFM